MLNRKPIFACQYFMSKGHWQIYDHSPDAEEVSGDFRTMPVHEAPRKVVELAVKTANLIGDGLYGVDLKQAGDKVVVIEVNDNPNIDCGWRMSTSATTSTSWSWRSSSGAWKSSVAATTDKTISALAI